MKQIAAYVADHDPNSPQIKKSSALAMDAKHMAREIAKGFKTNRYNHTEETLMQLLASGIQPSRLYRQYRKLYRIKQKYDAAIAEEQTNPDDLPV